MNALERASRDRYLQFLNTFKTRLREIDCVGIVHCLQGALPSRCRYLTLKRADHVWQLELIPTTRQIKNRLLITKSRGYRALIEPIPLILSDQVLIDTSRTIA